jgi:D-lactate dehydrogenase (cytochrome)
MPLVPPEQQPLQVALGELSEILADRLSTELAARSERATDASHHHPGVPDAVARPLTTQDVSRVLQVCHHHRIAVIPYGAGSGVEGGVVAIAGGICLDLQGMNRVLEVHTDDGDCRVQAGVRRKQLNAHLLDTHTGLHFPVDPGADATLGGMAATRASGTEAVGYGTMREHVLGLTAVMADGRVIHTGTRARKSAAGYDLTHLLVGSEGTLAVITEVALRLAPIPAAMSAAVCPFPTINAAVAFVQSIIRAGLHPARCELLDEVQMDAVNRYADLRYDVQPTLFLEFHGATDTVAAAAEAAGQIAADLQGGPFRWATEGRERDRLWQARHDGYYACLALRPGCAGYVTDVCVPVSQLVTCIERTRVDLAKSELIAPLFGHVGDGNFHVLILFDPENSEELAEARQLGERIIDHALALGGTCTGEHGIGAGKIEALRREFGTAVDVMGDIKAALDPHGILNPGKVLAPRA